KRNETKHKQSSNEIIALGMYNNMIIKIYMKL
ncbi:MAG: hypothetical protein ACI8RD_013928, partial [Bacillariaceae sp.]